MTRSQPTRKPTRNHLVWLWGGIGGIVALVAAIAVWSTRGQDDAVSNGSVVNSISSAAETQPVAVVGTALPLPPEVGPDSAVGMTAPALQGFRFDGSPIDITPGGRPQMVVFLAHWCPHCNREIPVLQAWAAGGGVPADFDIVGVSTAVNNQRDNFPPSTWINDKQWRWPVLADSATSDAAEAYGVGSFPTFVLVGADGVVKARSSGELPVEQIDALVRQALGD